MSPTRPERLTELARVFLKLGAISFGGPVAHIALMRHEFVTRRRWLTDAAFLDLIGATNLIPGPNSTEMAIHIGRLRAGLAGLVVAGVCFILPAMAIVWGVAVAYVRLGALPEAQAVFYGVKPVVVAIVTLAIAELARTAVRTRWQVVLLVLAVAGAAANVHELMLLGICGVAGAGTRLIGRKADGAHFTHALIPIALQLTTAAPPVITSSTLFAVFFKAGALLFGSGYVLLAFLRADLVDRLHWLTEQQLIDAIAVGQFTPGPVFTTATFIGYVLDGPSGALLATAAIFLPAFVYVAVTAPIIPALRRSPVVGGMLDGVNVASLALMAAVTLQLGRAAIVDGVSAGLAVCAMAALVFLRMNPAWIMAVGALVGAATLAMR
jgi:chromate transporter